MSSDNLSKKEQEKIVEKLISSLDEMGPEDELDEELYDQLDSDHQQQVDDAIREFADAAIGSDTWDSDEW
ncbi:hypothetical protein [Evansella cellulosilytica]|uniref:Uncharacterized protein n=1 Tax=Evansella cellulosilytica (strain ATCC 21833 / DSM 2522 / FERM P-1141 / JCM 9156 / N-4) TaxID=649639 RepID=E6TZL5_EVAC2|nr:hypothetical protein [Evansella cellulosilytica]ADU31321.1 hypothetical protein Bcell_3077 [Evansella cellulosilytica DSM 2522]